jgi:HPt (histidine-containing phosphotransfer) domain-containing protein
MPAKPIDHQAAILSAFAHDPDMQDLIVAFVNELPARISRIGRDIERADRQAVQRLAHQLKGAAGGYGFHSITEAAAALEARAEAVDSPAAVQAAFAELAGLCRRASAAAPGAS